MPSFNAELTQLFPLMNMSYKYDTLKRNFARSWSNSLKLGKVTNLRESNPLELAHRLNHVGQTHSHSNEYLIRVGQIHSNEAK